MGELSRFATRARDVAGAMLFPQQLRLRLPCGALPARYGHRQWSEPSAVPASSHRTVSKRGSAAARETGNAPGEACASRFAYDHIRSQMTGIWQLKASRLRHKFDYVETDLVGERDIPFAFRGPFVRQRTKPTAMARTAHDRSRAGRATQCSSASRRPARFRGSAAKGCAMCGADLGAVPSE